MTGWRITSRSGGPNSWWRSSWSSSLVGGWGVGQPAPALARPVQDRPDQMRQERSAGKRPMTLVRRRVSPKLRTSRLAGGSAAGAGEGTVGGR